MSVESLNELVATAFSGISPLVIEDVVDEGERVVVRARTPGSTAVCPACGALSERVHGYHWRTVADLPIDGRRVVVRVRVRRLVCPTRGCRHTFREQLPGVLERYQRRTARLTRQIKAVVKELAGRAGSRLLAKLAIGLSRHTALRTLLRIALPTGRVPRVIGVDDFALRRRHRYATVVIDAETHERIDVLPDRTADTLEAWLRENPGVEVVCRDGSATYAEAIRRALPDAVQVTDRWHLWHNLCETALSEVKAHSTCWAAVLDTPIYEGPRAQTTLERWHQVHGLLQQRVSLLECARRLQLSLNTVKRYARADRPERMLRVPKYRASLVDPYRDHLRRRRAEDPAVPVQHLFEEIKALGFTGCLNLLHKYINQGRADADRSHISPRRLARMLLTRPENLKSGHRDLLDQLTAACPEMTHLATSVRTFAQLLKPRPENVDALDHWITQVRAADLPHLHAFTRGLERDNDAVIAALTLPYSNGPTEGVNTKTKRIARQMHGRAGFNLLRHRILLG
ncbi:MULTISPECIES: ISL3-like element IS466 family transposase [Streptomyces]|uniref:Transposase n=5 Tax=Streptomyces TaxID=1883 RepID=Q9R2U5_STRCO|nr:MULTISPECIES: ISL3-like element IS466 family transposase [Streptomyces]MYU42993.1 ISL3-like element IS466 family transposase [Streptomyces sp. SID7813]MDX2930818.1 ISL3-like element IS466 family transposase [Streptomyces sp. NRRL_B-16638]MDX3406279.1 ISL3-like element IS466 family transposase [Streptomyces sp. ME02-6977A]MYU43014.1 ISL3-like element IS466 family transposase [Streptomyces sp. SID7813]NSL85170.1 ISL3-like element IS466 family transposase [Streptomyces coelicolor]